MHTAQKVLVLLISLLGVPFLHGESEPLDSSDASMAPYKFAGRVFGATSANSGKLSGSGTAVGPGIVLTAAHVYWREAWVDGALPEGASPWLAFREWYPAASSSQSESFENVASVVSLASYDDILHEYDDNLQDNTSPFEAFNRDSLLLVFSDDTATPHGIMRVHPQAAESGFLGSKNFFEVVGYPSAKYSGSDSRKWRVHTTLEKGAFTVTPVPSLVFDGGYTYENRLYTGGENLDSYAGNSGGPVIARAGETEPWLIVGVYIGSNALFRGMDAELSAMIDAATSSQIAGNVPQFRFSASEFSLTEGGNSVPVGVERLGSATGPVSVELQVVDLTPEAAHDYSHNYDLQWADGDSEVKEILIQAPEDELREGPETHLLYLDSIDLQSLAVPNKAVVTVEDNDLNGPLDQWTIVDEVGAVDYSEVVFAEGKFVSVGATNAVYWTPDFQEVGVMDFPELNRLFQLTHAQGLFVGCGDGPQIIVSENGIDWEIVALPTSVSILSIQYGLGLFVGVGGIDANSFSQGEIWVSEDARTWTKVYDEQHDRFDDVEFGNGIFLARAGSEFYSSTDGMIWQKLVTQGISDMASDLEFGDGVFVNADQLGGIYLTENGVDWTQVREADEEAFYGVGFRNGYFIATGISGKLSTSSDGGLTWVDRLPPTYESLWHGITAVGKMMVIGNNGLLMTTDLPEYFDFLHEPEGQTVFLGSKVSFFAEFVSSVEEGWSYQWQKDGQDLVGETASSLNISAASSVNAGDYELVVTVGGEEYRTTAATLAVDSQIAAPANLISTTSTSRGVTLSWEDWATDETGYLIERRSPGSDEWETLTSLIENSTSYLDRFLLPDTQYEYRVSTISDLGIAFNDSDPIQTLTATNFVNLSTRGLVGNNDNVMIGGFVIPQGPDMTLYIRGLGPSLQASGISNTISDPSLRLVRSQLPEPFEIVNTDWMDSVEFQSIFETNLAPEDEHESAILATLPPGSYTVILSNEVDELPAVGMIEIYDATEGCSDCRLINLSTRGLVGNGDELMIGGLVVFGSAEKGVLVRALGPGLTDVTSTLLDPFLKMVPNVGQEVSNDDWSDSADADIISGFGLPLLDDKEAAGIFQIQEGSYTFHISGVGGTTGVALFEIYEIE